MAVIDWFSSYVNLLLYETAHQEYNSSFLKLCNVLYLLLIRSGGTADRLAGITQDDLADILGISRVHLTRGLSLLRNEKVIRTRRKQIEVVDPLALKNYCSFETI